MTSLAALLLAVPIAAPVPNVPQAPSLEGKYTLLISITSSGRGRGPGGGGFAADPTLGGGFGTGSAARRETTITKDTITIEGRTATTWEYKIDPTTKPMGIEITVIPLRGKKTKHLGIVEMTGDKLSIAYAAEGNDRPKDFEDADGVAQFIFQKAPPPPRAEYRIVVLKVGHEVEAEKAINALAKEGYEVAFTTAPAAAKGGSPDEAVIHLVLKRLVK